MDEVHAPRSHRTRDAYNADIDNIVRAAIDGKHFTEADAKQVLAAAHDGFKNRGAHSYEEGLNDADKAARAKVAWMEGHHPFSKAIDTLSIEANHIKANIRTLEEVLANRAAKMAEEQLALNEARVQLEACYKGIEHLRAVPVESRRVQGVDCPLCEDGTAHTHAIRP